MADWTPAYKVIETKVCTDMEPMVQLMSVLFDTLNDKAFDVLPPSAKAEVALYVGKTYGLTG